MISRATSVNVLRIYSINHANQKCANQCHPKKSCDNYDKYLCVWFYWTNPNKIELPNQFMKSFHGTGLMLFV